MIKSSELLAAVILALVATIGIPQEDDRAWAQNLTVTVPLTAVNIAEIIQDSVPALTTREAFTVPPGQILFITEVVISNGSTNPAVGQRILRGDNPATAFITVGPNSAFSHTFASGLAFTAGQVVAVRNGTNLAGSTHFYLRGFLVSSP